MKFMYNFPFFFLFSLHLGSGILNQPYVFSQAGIAGAISGYVLASLMMWLGLNLMTKVGLKVKIFDYGSLAKATLGYTGEVLVDVAIIIGCVGSLTGYIIGCYTTVTINGDINNITFLKRVPCFISRGEHFCWSVSIMGL